MFPGRVWNATQLPFRLPNSLRSDRFCFRWFQAAHGFQLPEAATNMLALQPSACECFTEHNRSITRNQNSQRTFGAVLDLHRAASTGSKSSKTR